MLRRKKAGVDKCGGGGTGKKTGEAAVGRRC